MAARLKDIANDLGLSAVSASKVLRNHPDIGEETRKRVLKRMRELKYLGVTYKHVISRYRTLRDSKTVLVNVDRRCGRGLRHQNTLCLINDGRIGVIWSCTFHFEP